MHLTTFPHFVYIVELFVFLKCLIKVPNLSTQLHVSLEINYVIFFKKFYLPWCYLYTIKPLADNIVSVVANHHHREDRDSSKNSSGHGIHFAPWINQFLYLLPIPLLVGKPMDECCAATCNSKHPEALNKSIYCHWRTLNRINNSTLIYHE